MQCARSFIALHIWLDATGLTGSSLATPPCAASEVPTEVQDISGIVCASKCQEEQLACPSMTSMGMASRPTCMLRDSNDAAYCALLCRSTSECPGGGRCLPLQGVRASICSFTESFDNWAKEAPVKLAYGLPARVAQGHALKKAKEALDNLKRRYSIPDSDSDLLVAQESFGEMVTTANAKEAMMSMVKILTSFFHNNERGSGLDLGSWKSDLDYAERRLVQGPGGVMYELHDTMNDLRHLQDRGSATRLLRLLIELMVVYIAAGALFNSYVHNASGLQVIPHVGFWMQYPALVQDGIAFTRQLFLGDAQLESAKAAEAPDRPGGYVRRGAPSGPQGNRDTSEEADFL